MCPQLSRPKVFVSYSRQDGDWLEKLRPHLDSLAREKGFPWLHWDDTKARPGSVWRDEMNQILDSATVAVLLVSKNFLASDFITEHELPCLLDAATDKRILLLPIVVGPCRYGQHPGLSRFQSVNPVTEPLLGMQEVGVEEVFLKVTTLIDEALCGGNGDDSDLPGSVAANTPAFRQNQADGGSGRAEHGREEVSGAAVGGRPEGAAQSDEVASTEEVLRQRLTELAVRRDVWEGFAKRWAEASGTGTVFSDAEALLADLLRQRPIDILEWTLTLAPMVGEAPASAAGKPDPTRDVAIGILLLGCDRYIRDAPGFKGSVCPSDGMIAINARHRVAAAVIAALWSGQGAKLWFDRKTRAIVVCNVLQDLPAQEYGFQGLRECVQAELQAMVIASMRGLDPSDRVGLLPGIGKSGLPSLEVQKRGVERYKTKEGVKPIVAAGPAGSDSTRFEEDLHQIAKELGLRAYSHGDSVTDRLPAAGVDAASGNSLQADVLYYVENVYALLHPQPVEAARRLALADMHFRVALSFAGEHRPYVEEVARALARELGQDEVFYDNHFKHDLAVVDLDVLLQSIYHHKSDLVVVFLCGNYQKKEWCGLEWRSVRDLIKSKRHAQRIMFFRFDDAPVDGVFSQDGAIDCREHLSAEAADLILKRLQVTPPQA